MSDLNSGPHMLRTLGSLHIYPPACIRITSIYLSAEIRVMREREFAIRICPSKEHGRAGECRDYAITARCIAELKMHHQH